MSSRLAAPAREESPRREAPWTDRLLARAGPKVRTWVLFAWEALPRRSDLGDLPGYGRSLRLLWTLFGEYTMLFPLRARTLHRLARQADRDGVPGALVDCGTWNGGSTALLSAASPRRPIWAFDSFEGTSAATEHDGLTPDERAFSAGQCRGEEANLRQAVAMFGSPANLEVRAGWFQDTLAPAAGEVGPIAVLHVDADWYEPVRLALEAFYPLVSPGGWIVIDDYGALPGAARATEEFRAAVGDAAPLVRVDQTGRYWRKPRAA